LTQHAQLTQSAYKTIELLTSYYRSSLTIYYHLKGITMSAFRLLIIDDEVSIRDGFKRFLSVSIPEVEVITAEDGNIGLQLAQLEEPNLILLDLSMPVMTGLEALNQMQFIKLSIQTVIMTAFGTENNKDMARACSQNEHIQILRKPVDLDELETIIRKAMAE
jgi:YesN/AraC family two-component response regulator